MKILLKLSLIISIHIYTYRKRERALNTKPRMMISRWNTLIFPSLNHSPHSSRVPSISITLDKQSQRGNDTDHDPGDSSDKHGLPFQLLRIRSVRTPRVRTTGYPTRGDIERIEIEEDFSSGGVQGVRID